MADNILADYASEFSPATLPAKLHCGRAIAFVHSMSDAICEQIPANGRTEQTAEAEGTSPIEDLRNFIRTLHDQEAEATRIIASSANDVINFNTYPLERFLDVFGELCWITLFVTGILIAGAGVFF
ncbi:hypothetical protein HZA56_02585 [Candidatus Poribacteria bacterium]|nr:hypothetical protein [Candidatus Poribacteria bacterium]